MGREAQCKVTHAGRQSEGKALLETDFVLFRGEFRLKLPFAEMKSVTACDGVLRIRSAESETLFELGEQASKWARKILHPPSRVDKLGVKRDTRVAVIGLDDDEGFREELASTGAVVGYGRPRSPVAMIIAAAAGPPDLSRIHALSRHLHPEGAIWVVYPKGRKEIPESAVRSAGLAAGLVDVKVAAFSPTHTALKFVIPKAARAAT